MWCEEALPISPVKIVERGVMRADIEREYLHRSRTPELNRLDLLGQIAANRVQTERILELCHEVFQLPAAGIAWRTRRRP